MFSSREKLIANSYEFRKGVCILTHSYFVLVDPSHSLLSNFDSLCPARSGARMSRSFPLLLPTSRCANALPHGLLKGRDFHQSFFFLSASPRPTLELSSQVRPGMTASLPGTRLNPVRSRAVSPLPFPLPSHLVSDLGHEFLRPALASMRLFFPIHSGTVRRTSDSHSPPTVGFHALTRPLVFLL